MDVSADFVLPKSTCGSCIQNIILSCLQANEHMRPSFAHLVRSLMQVSQVAPAPPARDIEDIEEKPSTPSTTDSVESTVSDEKAAEAIATRFKKIKDFLMTPPALMALGEDSVQEMLRELEEAQAREARYVSCLESARAGSEVTTAAGSSIPSLEGLMSHVALLGSSDSLPSCRATPSLGSSQVAVASAHVSEYVVPLVNSGGRWIETKRLPAPEQNAWTLTSYVSPALRRKDYASAEAAWAAYADEKGSPCVLRGPAGVEAAARAWVPLLLACLARVCACSDSGSSTCLSSRGTVPSVELVEHDAEQEEAVQEDVNDPDLIMHMQMKVKVDIPPNAEGGGTPHQHKEIHQPPSEARKLAQNTLPAQERPLSGSGAAAMVVAKSSSHSWDDSAAFSVIQMWARSLPLLQIATVLGIIIVCLLFWKLVNIAERTVMKGRSARVEAQFDASAKLQQLLRALRFEPSCEGAAQPLPREMQPVTEYDSGNNTEEEPEAEAAVESAVIAIAKRAKKVAGEACQEIAMEVSKMKKAHEKTEVGLKVQVLSC